METFKKNYLNLDALQIFPRVAAELQKGLQ